MGIIEGTSFTPKLKPYKPVGRPKPDRHWTQDAMGVIGVARALGPLFDSAAKAITRGTGEDELLEAIAAEEAAEKELGTVLDKNITNVPGLDKKQAANFMERFKATQRDFVEEEAIKDLSLAEVESFGPQYIEERVKGMGAPGAVPSMDVPPLSRLQEQVVSPLPEIPRPTDSRAVKYYDVARERALADRAKQKSAIPQLVSLYRMSLEELRNLAQWGLSSDPSERLIEMKRLNKAAAAVGKAELGASGFWSALGGETGEARGRQYVLKDAKTRKDFDEIQATKDALTLESGALGVEAAEYRLKKQKDEDEKKAKGGKGRGSKINNRDILTRRVMFNQKGNAWIRNPLSGKIKDLKGLTPKQKRTAQNIAQKYRRNASRDDLTVNDFVQSQKTTQGGRGKKSVDAARREAQKNLAAKPKEVKVKDALTTKEAAELSMNIKYLLGEFGEHSTRSSPSKTPELTAALNKTDWTSGNVKNAQAKLRTLINKLQVRVGNFDQKKNAAKIKELQGDIGKAERVKLLLGVISEAKKRGENVGRGRPPATGASQGKEKNVQQVGRDAKGKLQ